MCQRLLLPIALLLVSYPIAAHADGHFRILHTFEDKPATAGPVVFGPSGVAFGVSSGGGNPTCTPGNGCGTVYSLWQAKDGTWRFRVIYLFKGGADGWGPSGRLLVDAKGNLYGTTWFGGSQESGTIFELTPSHDGQWKYRVLHSFTGYDGQIPSGGLIADDVGNLYGVTGQGGTYDAGTAFELVRNSDGTWIESVLHNFSGVAEGFCPAGPLAFDKKWNLYGTTTCGGKYNQGTAFKLTRDSVWSETVLYNFGAFVGDGGLPFFGPVLDEDGNVFGTTWRGGSRGGGVVFELSNQTDGTWVETILHDFIGGGDGFEPWAPVAIDSKGNLYGSTQLGGNVGTYGYGTLFALTFEPNTGWRERILHNFSDGRDGELPGGVTLRSNGDLREIYGFAWGGTAGYGVVYEFGRF